MRITTTTAKVTCTHDLRPWTGDIDWIAVE
jgi:hypothetical protein